MLLRNALTPEPIELYKLELSLKINIYFFYYITKRLLRIIVFLIEIMSITVQFFLDTFFPLGAYLSFK